MPPLAVVAILQKENGEQKDCYCCGCNVSRMVKPQSYTKLNLTNFFFFSFFNHLLKPVEVKVNMTWPSDPFDTWRLDLLNIFDLSALQKVLLGFWHITLVTQPSFLVFSTSFKAKCKADANQTQQENVQNWIKMLQKLFETDSHTQMTRCTISNTGRKCFLFEQWLCKSSKEVWKLCLMALPPFYCYRGLLGT